MKNSFKKLFKKKTWYEKESRKADNLFNKLIKLRVVKLILIILIIILITPLIVFLYYKPKVQENITYGVTYSWKYADALGLDWQDAYIKILDDLKPSQLRLIAYWEDVEGTKDSYDYSNIKWQLEEAGKRDVRVILTLGRKVPRYPECYPPSWWKEIDDEEVRNQELYEYVETTVNELKSYRSIYMWQVENEPFWKFGECEFPFKRSTVKKEVEVVKQIDPRPIIIQDSGEGGLWYPTYSLGDFLGISMYRKIWYDFWGAFFGNFIYFKYPLANWTYAMKASLFQVPYQKVIVTELQGEPWGPGINSMITDEQKNKTMSRNDFYATIDYAQKAGFKDLYLWGAEWWLWEKEHNNNPFYWDTAKALFN